MTRKEAVEQIIEACHTAIDNDPAVIAARRALACQGLKLEYIRISADLSFRAPAPPTADEAFLRQLRIHPDIEVRE